MIAEVTEHWDECCSLADINELNTFELPLPIVAVYKHGKWYSIYKYSCGSSVMMSGISCVENSVLPPSAIANGLM